MVEAKLLQQAVLHCRDGVVLVAAEGDQPIVFVNPAFERLTGYSREEVLGNNCRFLQGSDRNQPELDVLREALAAAEPCAVTVRNYRKDGSSFFNELSIAPVKDDEGRLTHFIGIQKDITLRAEVDRQLRQQALALERLRREVEHTATLDGLTGIHNRRHFDHQLAVQWAIAQRATMPVAAFMADVDQFKAFNDTYGHQAGDECLRKVAARLVATFRRGSDIVARYGGEEFAAVATGMDSVQAARFAQALCTRVRELDIPHEAATGGRLTISVGYAVLTPGAHDEASALLHLADQALYAAKAGGRDRALAANNPAPPPPVAGHRCRRT